MSALGRRRHLNAIPDYRRLALSYSLGAIEPIRVGGPDDTLRVPSDLLWHHRGACAGKRCLQRAHAVGRGKARQVALDGAAQCSGRHARHAWHILGMVDGADGGRQPHDLSSTPSWIGSVASIVHHLRYYSSRRSSRNRNRSKGVLLFFPASVLDSSGGVFHAETVSSRLGYRTVWL